MAEREAAWRVFATEFNDATISITGENERSPNYVLTHTGAKANRVFTVGVVTEVENTGEDLWRARVADPTGAFTVYAGQYQPEAAIFLQDLEAPEYVALVGKTRTYEADDIVYTSLRPEEITRSNESIRDRWVVDTAELTMQRIRAMHQALDSGLEDEDLREYLVERGGYSDLAEGVQLALEQYNVDEEYLDRLEREMVGAVEAIAPTAHAGEDVKTRILEVMEDLDDDGGVEYDELIRAAVETGVGEDLVEDAVLDLLKEGRCYEPRLGFLKKI